MSRSNSASAPKMWKMSFPPDVVVSIASVIDLKPICRLLRPVIVSMRCLRDRPQPVETPDDQGVALPEVAQGFVEPCALCLGSGCGVGEDAGTACLVQGVFLEIKGLV